MKNKKNKIISTRHVSLMMMTLIIFSVFTYVYSYQSSITYASAIQEIEQNISNTQSIISDIEYQIVQKKREVNKDIALENGFRAIEDQVFVKRNSSTALNE